MSVRGFVEDYKDYSSVLVNLKDGVNLRSIDAGELDKQYLEFNKKVDEFIQRERKEEYADRGKIAEIEQLRQSLPEIYSDIVIELQIKEEEEWKRELKEEEIRQYKMPAENHPEYDIFIDDTVNTKTALMIYGQVSRELYLEAEARNGGTIGANELAEKLEPILHRIMFRYDLLDEDTYQKMQQAINNWDPSQNNEAYTINSDNKRKAWMKDYNNTIATMKCALIQKVLLFSLTKAKAAQLVEQSSLEPMDQSGAAVDAVKLKAELNKKKFVKKMAQHIAKEDKSIYFYNTSHLYEDILRYFQGKYEKMCRAADMQTNELVDKYIQCTKGEKKPLLQGIRNGIEIKELEGVPPLIVMQINALDREYAQLQIFVKNKDLDFYSARILAAHASLSRQNMTINEKGKGKESRYTDLEIIKKNHSRITTGFVNVYYLITSVFVPLAIYRALNSKKTRGHYKFWKSLSYDVKKSAKKVEKSLIKPLNRS